LGNGQTPYLPKLGGFTGKDKEWMEISFFDFIILEFACFPNNKILMFGIASKASLIESLIQLWIDN
jgi:hypothetical protein